MTEKEVVDFLRNNRTKGVAFLFLPEDVHDWIHEHFDDPNLFYLDSMGKWQYFKDTNFNNYDNVVFALPDTFYPQKPKGGWEEFEIDQRGNFHCFKDDDMHYFFWANWGIFLKAFSDEYTAFGGWQYPNCGAWYMNPKMLLSDAIDTHYADVLFQGEPAKCMPATPCKIRFWREKE